MYELVAFIEYVGRLPAVDSKRVRAHYIGYRKIRMQWIRNDDDKCHLTQVEGSYKMNMAFYKRVANQVDDEFDIDDEGIRYWKKSVVIRGVYHPPPSGGRGRGRGRITRSTSKAAAAAAAGQSSEIGADNPDVPSTSADDATSTPLTLDDMYILDDSSSSEEDKSGK